MKQQSFWAALMCAGFLTLTACGGGSSGGSSDSGGSDDNGSGDPIVTPTPDPDPTPNPDPTPDPMPAPTAYLCESHTADQVNVVGNNTYEFIADDGACFGTREDFSLVKREVPITLDLSETNSEFLSLSPMGRLAFKEAAGSLSSLKTLYLAFDLTNVSSSTMCLDFRVGRGAVLRSGENTVEDFSIEVLGDMFLAGLRYRNDCIPSGETRTVWGSATRSLSADRINSVDSITIQPDDIDVGFSSSLFPPRFLSALTPTEAVWTSSVETVLGNEQYSYDIVNSFTNDTADMVDFRSDIINILYFDESGYLLYDSLSRVSDYLGIDDTELTPEDLMVTADGGMISIQDEFTPIVPALGATQHILGRASKMVVHLDICSPDNC